MKAAQFARYGGPEVLHIAEVDPPDASKGQGRIPVRPVGANAIDRKICEGHMQKMTTLTLLAGTGRDAASVVDDVGEGGTDVAVGDEVFRNGSTTAEYAVLSSWSTNLAELSFKEAAGYTVPIETATRIPSRIGVQPGRTLLVRGASGGVGSAVVQIAHQRGITVIGAANEFHQSYLRKLGATATSYGPDFDKGVRAYAADGVDAAADTPSSGAILELIEPTGEPTRVLSIADFGAPEDSAQISGTPTNAADAFVEAVQLLTGGTSHIPVETTLALTEVAQAQAANATDHVAGEVVATVIQVDAP